MMNDYVMVTYQASNPEALLGQEITVTLSRDGGEMGDDEILTFPARAGEEIFLPNSNLVAFYVYDGDALALFDEEEIQEAVWEAVAELDGGPANFDQDSGWHSQPLGETLGRIWGAHAL